MERNIIISKAIPRATSFVNAKGKICAIGAGTMGCGTAVEYAKAGYNVSLYVRNAGKHQKALDDVRATLADLVKHGLINSGEVASILSRIEITDDKAKAAANADLVMESIAEDLAAKQKQFKDFDILCPAHTIFATNTSALDPTDIALVLSPERRKNFVVMHGFNPPQWMPVVEVVPGRETSILTINKAIRYLESIDKKPIPLEKATPGFVVNHIQVAILWAALDLHLNRNMPAEQIDAAVEGIMGPRVQEIGPLELVFGDYKNIDSRNAQLLLAERRPAPFIHEPVAIANYFQSVAFYAALELVARGTAKADIVDKAFVASLGRRYVETGPLKSADLGGLDIFKSILRTCGYLDKKTRILNFLVSKIATDQLGTKSLSKTGIYSWTDQGIADTKERRIGRLVWHIVEDAWQKAAILAGKPRKAIRPPKHIKPGLRLNSRHVTA